jgi:putative Mg2+ transporter-C (MgtC) family protein
VTWIIGVQIVAAAGLGALLGVEREMSAQPAGLRTHMLVALGAALFTLAGAHIVGSDPTRIAAQVVTGIGFLGGGAIVREGATTRGLTTAASLWVTAAVGLAVGLRSWGAAVVTSIVALAVLRLIRMLEHEYIPRRRGLEVTLTLIPGATIDHVERSVREILNRCSVLRLSYTSDGQALMMRGYPPAGESFASVGERLRHTPGVVGVDLVQ